MMIRALDANGDWTFGKGKSSYKRQQLALNQNLKTRLLEWKGDCFFDNEAGVDWKNRLAKADQASPLQEEIRVVILKTDGVAAVDNLDLVFDSISRNLTISYTIQTIYIGEPISESIEI